jgi:SAM-dependent methyltransferase
MESDRDRPHSERYFTDARDHWWHEDYLALLAKRIGLSTVRTALEVGAGQGHFARAWAPHLNPGFAFTAVDREERSLAVARARCEDFCAARGLQGTWDFVRAHAERLPFEDGTFDMVCCQTLLIHLRDPREGAREMIRVCKPGGLVVAVEPNNLAGLQRLAIAGPDADLESQLREVAFLLRCSRGKAALGLGWNHLGAQLPELFRGLDALQCFNNDRAWAMSPPYDHPQQRAALDDLRTAVADRVFIWDRDEARRYFTAGGGAREDFERDYDLLLAAQSAELEACLAGRWSELTAFAGLIVAGRKPTEERAARGEGAR